MFIFFFTQLYTITTIIDIIAMAFSSSKSCLTEKILLNPFNGLILLALGASGLAVTIHLCCSAFPSMAIITAIIRMGITAFKIMVKDCCTILAAILIVSPLELSLITFSISPYMVLNESINLVPRLPT